MIPHKLNIRNAISYGWQTSRKNILSFIILLILVAGTNVAIEFSLRKAVWHGLWMYIAMTLVSFIINGTLRMGLIRIGLKMHDDKQFEGIDLIYCIDRIVIYLISSIIQSLIIIVGLVLLLVPGIIWAIKYHFYVYLIVDRNLGPIEALKKSAQMTQGVKLDLFFFFIILLLMNMLGALCLVVGLFVTIPTTILALVHVYRQLLNNLESEESSERPVEVPSNKFHEK